MLFLEVLDLSNNKLACIAPDALAKLSLLSDLDINNNNLTCFSKNWPLTAEMDLKIKRCPANFTCSLRETLHESSSSSTPVQSSSSRRLLQSSSSSLP
eukprot:366122-Hanusia_phi.AAC.1